MIGLSKKPKTKQTNKTDKTKQTRQRVKSTESSLNLKSYITGTIDTDNIKVDKYFLKLAKISSKLSIIDPYVNISREDDFIKQNISKAKRNYNTSNSDEGLVEKLYADRETKKPNTTKKKKRALVERV